MIFSDANDEGGLLRRDGTEEVNEKIRQTNGRLPTLAANQRVFCLGISDKLVEPDGSISCEIMPNKYQY